MLHAIFERISNAVCSFAAPLLPYFVLFCVRRGRSLRPPFDTAVRLPWLSAHTHTHASAYGRRDGPSRCASVLYTQESPPQLCVANCAAAEGRRLCAALDCDRVTIVNHCFHLHTVLAPISPSLYRAHSSRKILSLQVRQRHGRRVSSVRRAAAALCEGVQLCMVQSASRQTQISKKTRETHDC